ncbi:MAG: hypothetical protein HXS44_00340 [Theionarchaea archaeon]|nr:hypothetical protein [Theionarchaea archaeon]
MNEEKGMKHRMAMMTILMSSLSMITVIRDMMTWILNGLPEGAKNRSYFNETKGNTDSYTSIKDPTLIYSDDLYENFREGYIFSRINYISPQMITFLHKHLHIMST